MTRWEEFEKECANYLNRKYGTYAMFKHKGGADSSIPDIFVRTKAGHSFFIEAKYCPAQCGQFVLLPNIITSSFEYSRQNDNPINKYAMLIMDYMNKHFNAFREAGTTGKNIDMTNSEEVFSKWVVDAYQKKNVRYFITNNYTLLPIEKFNSYFNITAKYRIKRSGSSSVGKKRIDAVVDYIAKQRYSIRNVRINIDKLFVSSPRNLHDQRFVLGAYEYMFSLRDKEYEIRKLANTYNANVIFSITRKGNEPGMSDYEFISSLQR